MIVLILTAVNTVLISLLIRYAVKTRHAVSKIQRMQRAALRYPVKKDEPERAIRSVPNV